MVAYKLLTMFAVLLLTQCTFSKPVDKGGEDTNSSETSSEEEISKNAIFAKIILLNKLESLLTMIEKFGHKADNVSRYVLKDEALIDNTNPEVVEFKENLQNFLQQHETNTNAFSTVDKLDIYINATSYLDLPEEELTTDGKLILEILNKYDAKRVFENFVDQFDDFMDDFTQALEDNKSNLSKNLVDFFEIFIADFKEKSDEYSSLMK